MYAYQYHHLPLQLSFLTDPDTACIAILVYLNVKPWKRTTRAFLIAHFVTAGCNFIIPRLERARESEGGRYAEERHNYGC